MTVQVQLQEFKAPVAQVDALIASNESATRAFEIKSIAQAGLSNLEMLIAKQDAVSAFLTLPNTPVGAVDSALLKQAFVDAMSLQSQAVQTANPFFSASTATQPAAPEVGNGIK